MELAVAMCVFAILVMLENHALLTLVVQTIAQVMESACTESAIAPLVIWDLIARLPLDVQMAALPMAHAKMDSASVILASQARIAE